MVLPPTYPGHALPALALRPRDAVPRPVVQCWLAGAAAAMAAVAGECAVWAALEWLRDAGPAVRLDHAAAAAAAAEPPLPSAAMPMAPALAYRLEAFWFHHIYDRHKRHALHEHAAALTLTGFCLPGKPGVVVVEGPADAVAEFGARVRRLPWQRMSSRYVHTAPCVTAAAVDALRAFASFGAARIGRRAC